VTAGREVWLTPAQASRRSGVSAITLITWTETRGLEFRRSGNGPREYLASSLDAITDAKGAS
jgi:DNA-binding transcriptional MerR regulator